MPSFHLLERAVAAVKRLAFRKIDIEAFRKADAVPDEGERSPDARDHVSVCICTYKRPLMLARALDRLQSQIMEPSFIFDVVITDNDADRSAQPIATQYQERGALKIVYDVEPIQSIALARNRSIRNSTGNLVAFIDDDEFPAEDWLSRMHRCLKDHNAAGVLGPVLPHFPAGAPKWLSRSGLCDRPRSATGSPIRGTDLRTGNILFQRRVFMDREMWFDPARGGGGEDGDFLFRQIKAGHKYIWCDEALVYETVPEERLFADFYLKRYFKIGKMVGRDYRRLKMNGAALISFMSILGLSVALPFSAFRGKALWMRVLCKVCYHGGAVLSFLDIPRMKDR